MNNEAHILTMNRVSFKYPRGRRMILQNVSAEFVPGKLYSVEGESGAGKSTLLTLLAGLAKPTSGEIRIDGMPVRQLGKKSRRRTEAASEEENVSAPESRESVGSLPENTPRSVTGLTLYRRCYAATVPQANLLFDGRTVMENVLYPMLLKGVDPEEAGERARGYLRDVRLDEELWDHFPAECSGGEQKRVAFARAMGLDNPILLADEPTANLDRGTSAILSEILKMLAEERGKLVLAVTHDERIPALADKRLFLRAGVLEDE